MRARPGVRGAAGPAGGGARSRRFGGLAELGAARRGGRRARGVPAREPGVGGPREAPGLERARPSRPWEPGGGGGERSQRDTQSVPGPSRPWNRGRTWSPLSEPRSPPQLCLLGPGAPPPARRDDDVVQLLPARGEPPAGCRGPAAGSRAAQGPVDPGARGQDQAGAAADLRGRHAGRAGRRHRVLGGAQHVPGQRQRRLRRGAPGPLEDVHEATVAGGRARGQGHLRARRAARRGRPRFSQLLQTASLPFAPLHEAPSSCCCRIRIHCSSQDTSCPSPSLQVPEANCTYFKFFTTGENAHIFQRTTKKEVNQAAAVIAVLGLAVMALGCLCIIMVLSKGAEFLLRVGAVCFGLSGLLVLVSLEVFRHSVRALMQRVSPEPPAAPALTYEYSWSLGCGVGAGVVLMLGGGCFLLLTLPPGPWSPLCPKWGQRAP